MIFDWLPINKDTSWTGIDWGRGWEVQMCLFWCVYVCAFARACVWERECQPGENTLEKEEEKERGGGPSQLGHKEEPVAPLGNHSSCLHLKYPCEVSISG